MVLWTEDPALPPGSHVVPVKLVSIPETQCPDLCNGDISSQVIVGVGVVSVKAFYKLYNCCLSTVVTAVETDASKMK